MNENKHGGKCLSFVIFFTRKWLFTSLVHFSRVTEISKAITNELSKDVRP